MSAAKNNVQPKRRWRMSRRGFLIGAGVLGTGVALGVYFGGPALRLRVAQSLNDSTDTSFAAVKGEPTAWIEVTPEATVLYLTKVEMGQGVHTALAQIAAEELEVPWEQLQVRMASTSHPIEDSFGTGGSTSVISHFTNLREVSATMREILRTEAARKLEADISEVTLIDGVFQAGGHTLTFAETVAGVEAWDVPKKAPPLKPIHEFTVIGQSKPRIDFEKKLTGRALYGYDMRVPNMLYGAVARPQSIQGTLDNASEGGSREVAGVTDVVLQDGFAGVVATSRASARAGVQALSLTWNEHEGLDTMGLNELCTVQEGKGITIQDNGNAPKILKAAKEEGTLIRAEYRSPPAIHAHLEPQAALADPTGDTLIIYTSTQMPQATRDTIAKELKLKKEQVEVRPTYLGGGFGRRLGGDVALEAARLAHTTQKPVHVGWSREDEFHGGYVRPPTHSVLSATLAEGRITAMEHQLASGDVAFGFLPAAFSVIMGADFGAWRGGMLFYDDIPNRHVLSQRVKLPFATGWWRGLGLLANTFAIESFMDELAYAAKQDPLAFRLAHLGASEDGQRFKRVLEKAAELANWGGALPEGHALGIAANSDVNTKVAQVAEVSIDNGRIRVHKVSCAMDCGLTINPDGAVAQTQGSIIMGLSSTFFEKLTLKNSRFEAQNFDRYPLITMRDTPDIEVALVGDAPEPYGVGEPPIGPIAAAVGNAVYALTKERLRELPLELPSSAESAHLQHL